MYALPKLATTTKNCLMCDGPFESEGSGHRVCGRCKKKEAWRLQLDSSVLRSTKMNGGRVSPKTEIS